MESWLVLRPGTITVSVTNKQPRNNAVVNVGSPIQRIDTRIIHSGRKIHIATVVVAALKRL